MGFLASFTGATKVARPSDQLTNLNLAITQLKSESESKRLELEQKLAVAEANQKTLSRLQKAVDQAADSLAVADTQNSRFENAVEVMLNGMLTAWGKIDGRGDALPPPSYRDLVDCERAVEDYPRVRLQLAQRLAEAESSLSDFEQSIS